MKKIAIILAGGSGTRMGESIPKQFITVYGKPIIIYTIEKFESHPDIDEILVVCVDGWQNILKSYIKKYKIKKVKYIVPGGASGQESARNGVFYLEGKCSTDDMIILHDAVRPIIDDEVISNIIATCEKYGNAIAALPYNEQIYELDDDISTTKYIPRERLRRVLCPQAFKFKDIDAAYHKAFEEKIGIYGSSCTNTMMVDLGERLYFALGTDKDIKITTQGDLEMFKAYVTNQMNDMN